MLWKQTQTGVFKPQNPEGYDYPLQEIANALGKVCRFGGHTNTFYSVAEHCYSCSNLLDLWGASAMYQLAALLHDAQEAYTGDMPSPYKQMFPEFKLWETRVQKALLKTKGVPYEIVKHPIIKQADLQLLQIERACLLPEPHIPWPEATWPSEPVCWNLSDILCPTPYTPEQAATVFIGRYYQLQIQVVQEAEGGEAVEIEEDFEWAAQYFEEEE